MSQGDIECGCRRAMWWRQKQSLPSHSLDHHGSAAEGSRPGVLGAPLWGQADPERHSQPISGSRRPLQDACSRESAFLGAWGHWWTDA